ncbi:hypothetical protein C4559_03215 [Candidatus Microgenomates bacterium]|nr:MAG: hypothetical protein C4559_03215 [Candidatus Microgenomates bacterium]
MKNWKSKIIIVIFLFLFSFPSIFSLLSPGFFQTDDGEWMAIRFSAFHQAFRDGQIPVRFLDRLNNGFGYPVANFLYPGFMYLGEPIHFLGFNFVNTIKIIFGLSMISSAFFTYLWLSKFFNKSSAFIGSLFYLYTPYHLFDLYKRGSIGEVLSLAVIPFVFWQIERKSFLWISLGIFFLILSHNTLALLFIPLIFLYFLISQKGNLKFFLFSNWLPIIFGVFLSAFFWLPAIFELSYVRFSNVLVSDFKQYFAPLELIGLSTIIVLSFSTFFLYGVLTSFSFKNWAKLNAEKIFVLMLFISFLSIFFSSKISFSLWNYIPFSFIQFPFRLLSYLPLSLSFLCAFIIFKLEGKKQIIAYFVLFSVLVLSSLPYFKPAEFFDKNDSSYATNEGTTTVKNEYMPKWVKQNPTEHFKNKVEFEEGKGEINNLFYDSKKISFDVVSPEISSITVNIIYYPGWKAYINNKETSINFNNEKGLISLSMPKGESSVVLTLSETPLRLFADIISILSFISLIIFNKFFYNKIKS